MKRLLALFLMVLLCFLLLVPVSGASSLSFIAVNDFIPLTLTGDQRPFYSGGTLYVPYTAFNTASLGFYPSYSTADKTLTLFNRDKRLVFDLDAGTVTDETKTVQTISTASKGGTVFLPAAFCAGHFGVGVSDLTSLGGYQVVRFTTGTQVYDDSLFIQKIENLIGRLVQTADAAVSDNPTTPSTPVTPAVPDDPAHPAEPEKETARIYLAVTGAETLAQDLQTLEHWGLKATFFLSAQEIADNADLVRRLCAQGHYIGLTIAAPEDAAAQLAQANEALSRATQSKSLLVLLPQSAAQVELDGLYRVFIQPARRLTATEAAGASGQTRLMICDGATLAESLRILTNANCEFLPLRETSQLEP